MSSGGCDRKTRIWKIYPSPPRSPLITPPLKPGITITNSSTTLSTPPSIRRMGEALDQHPSDDMVVINFEESGYLDGGISFSHRRMEKLPRWQACGLDHSRGEEIRFGGGQYYSTLRSWVALSKFAVQGSFVAAKDSTLVCVRAWWDTFQRAFGSLISDSPTWARHWNPKKDPSWILKITAEYKTYRGSLLEDITEIRFPSKECAERYLGEWNEEVKRGGESMEYIVELFREGDYDVVGVRGEEEERVMDDVRSHVGQAQQPQQVEQGEGVVNGVEEMMVQQGRESRKNGRVKKVVQQGRESRKNGRVKKVVQQGRKKRKNGRVKKVVEPGRESTKNDTVNKVVQQGRKSRSSGRVKKVVEPRRESRTSGSLAKLVVVEEARESRTSRWVKKVVQGAMEDMQSHVGKVQQQVEQGREDKAGEQVWEGKDKAEEKKVVEEVRELRKGGRLNKVVEQGKELKKNGRVKKVVQRGREVRTGRRLTKVVEQGRELRRSGRFKVK